MSDPLSASVERLKKTANALNALSDEAAKVVQLVEAFLNKECSLGVAACVAVKSETEGDVHDPNARTVDTLLGYAKTQSGFRIAVAVCYEHEENPHWEPWSEVDRETKMQTVKKLPELLQRIEVMAEKKVAEAEEVSGILAAVVASIARKGVKK